MAIEYKVCGVPVDRMTYEKYMAKTFNTADGERSMHSIELWANSEEIKRELPNEWAEAKAIYDSVRAELNQMNKGKPVPNSGRALRGYVDDLDAIRAEAFKERECLENAFKDTEKMVNENRERFGAQYAQEMMWDAGKDLRTGLQNLESDYKAKVAKVRENMLERLGEIFDATPDKLDSNTMALLNTGICTADELGKLAEANAKNPVMLRIIQQSMEALAEKNAKSDSAMAMRIRGMALRVGEQARSKDSFLEAFDTMADFGARVTRREFHVAEAFNKRWEGEDFPKFCESFESADVYAN